MMKNFFKILVPSVLLCGQNALAYDYTSYSSAFSSSDYREALNMGLKFFGGQRCGNTNNWMLVDNPNVTKKYCHLKDGQGAVNGGSNGSYDLAGGWHDCGDHIKVATTMGYAATSLLIAYDIWPEAFQDNYDESYGSANSVPDVLDEAKIATDYFIKSFIDDNTFVYYVGNSCDHNCWVTSSYQSDLSVDQGGDPRAVWTTSEKGGPQAANYSSALSLMAMHYPDAAYQQKCKEAALKAYSYAKNHKDSQASIPEFYSSPNSEWTDELSLAAILLYSLTGEVSYLTEAEEYLNGKWESNSPLAWDTMSDYAYYYIVKADQFAGNGSGGKISDFLKKNVFNLHLVNGKSNSNGFPYYTSTWGTNKLALGGATAAALYIKLIDDGVISDTENDLTSARNFNRRVVDYILGTNEFGHTFLHGYKGDMTHRIHHRNAMGRNDNPVSSVKNTADFMFASGGVIGGPSSTGVFGNLIESGSGFTETEGGCDYNAPFIAAIANLVASMDPVDSDVKETRCSMFNVYPTLFDDYIVIDPVEINYAGNATAVLYDALGNILMSVAVEGFNPSVMYTSSLSKGVYILKVQFGQESKTFKLVK